MSLIPPISRASAAAARAVNTLGRPSRLALPLWSVASRSISSQALKSLSQARMKLEEWKQPELDKLVQKPSSARNTATLTKATAAATATAASTENPTITNLDALSTTSVQTTSDIKKKTDTNPVVAPVTTTTTTTNKNKPVKPANVNTTTTTPPLPFRLTPGPPYDPLDPDNNMGVDHSAWIKRQLPLFLGGGPFF